MGKGQPKSSLGDALFLFDNKGFTPTVHQFRAYPLIEATIGANFELADRAVCLGSCANLRIQEAPDGREGKRGPMDAPMGTA